MKHLAKAGLVCFLLQICLAAPAPLESSGAFEKLKSLQGTWTIQSGSRTLPIRMTYDVGSKGSIVTEQFGKELSVFYLNGNSLNMIHFCNAGNQPRLRMNAASRTGFLQFDTFEVAGPKDAVAQHVKRITYTIQNDRKIDLEIVWEGTDSGASEKYTLTKV